MAPQSTPLQAQRKIFPLQHEPHPSDQWCLDDVFDFGPYRGRTIATIAIRDPEYLEAWKKETKPDLDQDVKDLMSKIKFLTK